MNFSLKTLTSRYFVKRAFFDDTAPTRGDVDSAVQWLNAFEPETQAHRDALCPYKRHAETLVLFDFNGHARAKCSKIVGIHKLPFVIEEVEPFQALSQEDLEIRLALAKASGLLLILPAETLAIAHEFETGNGYVSVEALRVNAEGVARSRDGVYKETVEWLAQPQSLATLHRTAAESLLVKSTSDLLCSGGLFGEADRVAMKRQIALLESHIPVAPPERKASGAVIERSFISNGDTSSTAHMRRPENGWRRYPTSQEAWYYGTWTSNTTKQILTFAEGDVTLVTCENEAQFHAEMRELAAFHGKRLTPSMIGLSAGEVTLCFDCLTTIQDPGAKTICFQVEKAVRDRLLGVDTGEHSCPLMLDVRPSVLHSVADMEIGAIQVVKPADYEMNILDPVALQGGWLLSVQRLSLTHVRFNIANREMTLATEYAIPETVLAE